MTTEKKTLTDPIIRKLKWSGEGEDVYKDTATTGLSLRVTQNRKSWSLAYDPPDGKARTKMSLGAYPVVLLKAAQDRAITLLREAHEGRDPKTFDDRVKAAEAAERGVLIKAVWARYYAEVVNPVGGNVPKRSHRAIKLAMEADVLPEVGDLPIKEFNFGHWDTIRERFALPPRCAYPMANKVFSYVKCMLQFAVEKQFVQFNCLGNSKPPYAKRKRKRSLDHEEIKHFWHNIEEALSPICVQPGSEMLRYRISLILKLGLVLSKRSNEIAGARRCEFNWAQKVMVIPKKRIKGREDKAKDEILPLSDLAIKLFRAAWDCTNDEFLFPQIEAGGHIPPGHVSKLLKQALEPTEELPLGRLGMVVFQQRDLRRTVGSQMLKKSNGLNIPKDHKYLALNHKKTRAESDEDEVHVVSDEHYDTNDYLDEKRDALCKWGDFLARLVGEEIEMQKAA